MGPSLNMEKETKGLLSCNHDSNQRYKQIQNNYGKLIQNFVRGVWSDRLASDFGWSTIGR